MRRLVARLAPAAMILGAAPGGDGFTPAEETVVGSYGAGTFTAITSEGTTDDIGDTSVFLELVRADR